MTVSIRYRLFWIFLLVGVSFASPAGMAETGAGKIDLNKTLALYRGWAARDNFPDTVPLAYYNAYGQQVLQGGLPEGTRSRVFSYVKRCQRPDGGFVSNRKFPGKSNVIYTFYALKALELLDSLDGIDRDKVIAFIRSLIRENGSIAPSASETDRANLGSTYYAVASLKILGKTDLLDRDKTIAYVMSHRNKDGGFGVKPQGFSSPRGVSMAVQILAILNGLDKSLVPATVAYIENAIGQLTLSGKRHRAFSTIQASADSLSALVAMNALDEVETAPVQEYVESRYVPENGGFGPYVGYGTTPPSTFQGLYCLKILGKPEMPVASLKKVAAQSDSGGPGDSQPKP